MRRSCFQIKAFSRAMRASSTTSGSAICMIVSPFKLARHNTWLYNKGEKVKVTSEACSTSGMYFSVAILTQICQTSTRKSCHESENILRSRDPFFAFIFFSFPGVLSPALERFGILPCPHWCWGSLEYFASRLTCVWTCSIGRLPQIVHIQMDFDHMLSSYSPESGFSPDPHIEISGSSRLKLEA
jgi:hypothetical protein